MSADACAVRASRRSLLLPSDGLRRSFAQVRIPVDARLARSGATPGWTDDEIRSVTAPTFLVIGDQDFVRLDQPASSRDVTGRADVLCVTVDLRRRVAGPR